MKTPAPSPAAGVLAALARRRLADAPDADLVGRWVAGRDDQAFAELVRRYGPVVWRVARAGAGPAADDVFQATWVLLARHAGAVRDPGAVAGWLHKTARRAAARARRVEARQTVPPCPAEPAGEAADPLDRLTARELVAAVDEEIAALPDGLRAAVVLCGVEGLTLDEAAKRLGWTAGSVKGRLERARAKLRRRLDGRGLTLPAGLAGAAGLSAVPAAVADMALAIARGGAVPPGAAKLVAEVGGMTLTFWVKPAAAVVLAAGGLTFLGGLGDPGAGSRAPGRAVAAPVPKPAPAVLWSAPLGGDSDRSLLDPAAGVWAPDGRHVLVAGRARPAPGAAPAGVVRVWDPDAGHVAHTYRGTVAGFEDRAGVLAVSPDGKAVAAGGYALADGRRDGRVEVWDWGAGAPRLGLGGFPGDPVAGVAFSPDGGSVAGVAAGGPLGVWDAGTGAPRFVHWGKGRRAAVAFHPSSPVVAVADEATGLEFWGAGTGAEIGRSAVGNVSVVRTMAFAPAGWTAAVAGRGDRWGLAAVALVDNEFFPGGGLGTQNLRLSRWLAVDQGVSQVAFSPDGKHLAAACGDDTVRLFAPATAKQLAVAKEHAGPVLSVQFSPDGNRLLSVGRDAVKVWSVAELLKRSPAK